MAKKNKYSDLFQLCRDHGLEYKQLVYDFTSKKSDSLSSLTTEQYEDLLEQVKTRCNVAPGKRRVPPGDAQRKKLIRLAMNMHCGNGDMKEAVKALDQWCLKQKFKKGFMGHTKAEYDLLVTIFEQKVYADYLRDLNK